MRGHSHRQTARVQSSLEASDGCRRIVHSLRVAFQRLRTGVGWTPAIGRELQQRPPTSPWKLVEQLKRRQGVVVCGTGFP